MKPNMKKSFHHCNSKLGRQTLIQGNFDRNPCSKLDEDASNFHFIYLVIVIMEILLLVAMIMHVFAKDNQK